MSNKQLPKPFKNPLITDQHYVDVMGWAQEEIKLAADIFALSTGYSILDTKSALTACNSYSYLRVTALGDAIFVDCFKGDLSPLTKEQVFWPEIDSVDDNKQSLIDQIVNTKAEIENLTEQSEQVNKALSAAKNNLETLIDQLEKEITDKTGLSCVIGDWTYFKGVSEQDIVKALSGQAKQDKLTSIAELPKGVDINDPSTWQGGDIVECVKVEYRHPLTIWNEYVFNGYDSDDEYVSIQKDDNNQLNGFYREASEFQFVRRP